MLSNALKLPKKLNKKKLVSSFSKIPPLQTDFTFENNFDTVSYKALSMENIIDSTNVSLPETLLFSSTLSRRQHWRRYASGNDVNKCETIPPTLQRQPTYPLFPVFLTDNSKVYSNIACVVNLFLF